MKVNLGSSYLKIEGETEFEVDWLRETFDKEHIKIITGKEIENYIQVDFDTDAILLDLPDVIEKKED